MAMPVPTLQNNTQVTLTLAANAVAAIVIQIAKQRYQVDFSGQEANIQVLANFIGYFVFAGKGGK